MKPFAAVIALVALLPACVSVEVEPPAEYLLRVERAELPPALDGTPRFDRLRLLEIDLASHLRGITIARPDGRIDHLVLHTWAAPITEQVSDWLGERLIDHGVTRWVVRPELGGGEEPGLIVRIERFEIEESLTGDPVARVQLDVILVDAMREPIERLRVSGSTVTPSPTPTVSQMVAALGSALDEAVLALCARLEGAGASVSDTI